MSKKIRIKDANGAGRELLRASRMQTKAAWLLKQGDRKNGVEVYHASADHTAAAMEFIFAYCPHDQEMLRLLFLVTLYGVRIEARFNLRKEGKRWQCTQERS